MVSLSAVTKKKNQQLKLTCAQLKKRRPFNLVLKGFGGGGLTRFEGLIFNMPSDVVCIHLVVQEAILWLAEGACGDVSGTEEVLNKMSKMNEMSTSLFYKTWILVSASIIIDHLLLASGCRVTVGCSTSVLTSRAGNDRPSPWLQETFSF